MDLNSDSVNNSVTTPHTVFVEGHPLPENIKAVLDRFSKSLVVQKSAFSNFLKLKK